MVVRTLLVLGLALAAIGCGGEQEPGSLAVDFRTVGEVQWSMPVQFTAFNGAGEPALDLTLGHHGLPNRFEIPAGSYRLTVGWTGCPRNATVRGGRTTHVVVTLRGDECSIRLPDIANENAVTGGALFAVSGKADLRVGCTFAHRPSVNKEIRLGPVIQLSSSRRTVRGRAGAFAFRATIGAEPGERGALSIRVQSRSTGKPVASGLYQFLEGGPSNQFNGGHGFTGLVYAYLPSGAELQYFCRAL